MREKLMRKERVSTAKPILSGIVTLAVLLATGCAGSGSANDSGSTQVAPAGTEGAKSYIYLGTQSVDGSSNSTHTALNFGYGGGWSVNQDDTNNDFSYENTGHETSGYGNLGVVLPYAIPVVGMSTGTGFLSLTPATSGSTAGSAGYAVELPGEGELLRPSIATATANQQNIVHPSTPMVAPVVSAASATCPNLSGNVTYQFIAMGSQIQVDLIEHVVYGSVQIGGTGTVFTFSNLNMYGFDGKSLSPAAFPAGNCGTTQGGYVISSVALEDYTFITPGQPSVQLANNFTLSTALSPSGLFVMDQGQGSPDLISTGGSGGIAVPGATSLLGLVGVQQPASALNTGSMVAAKYAGFQYDPLNVSLGRAASIPVSFGQVAGSGTTMIGGGYANDDVTQTPATNITLNLGQQDSANNGLYKNVNVTVPDIFGGCIDQTFGGKDANGNPTCNFPGVAVAGSVGGKFVIFVSVNDLSQAVAHLSPYATLHFFLYQQ